MSPPPAEQFAARIFMGPALRAQPDRRLVDLVRDGYDAAFEEIVRRYRRPLDRFAAGIVGGRAEDITQDSFSKALLALRGSEPEVELRPWLYRIVRNTALNDLRDRAPATEQLSERLPGARSAAAEVETREELRDLMERLRALPEPQRAALVMRELDGLSHEEIAAALGVSGGAARQAIYRARSALREGFAFLVPLPALRLFAEHGAEMVKAGAATVLIAGTVGAGMAIKHHEAGSGNSNFAEAAPLAGSKHGSAKATGASASSSSSKAGSSSRHGSADGKRDRHGSGIGGSPGDGGRSGSAGSGTSGGGPNSGPGSRHSGSGGPGPSSGSGGDGSGDHGGSGSDGGGGGSSSGSGSGGSGSSGELIDDGGASGGGDGSGGSSSGPDGTAIAGEATSEPTLSDDSENDGGSSGSSGSDNTSGGSGEITTNSTEPNVSP